MHKYIENGLEKLQTLPKDLLVIATAAATLSLAACSSGTETVQEDSVSTELTNGSEQEPVSDDSPSSTAAEETTDVESTTPENPSATDNSAVESSIDSSFWNISEDKAEILTFLATEHNYPVSADGGIFNPDNSAEDIAYSFTRAFQAARNTKNLQPMAEYFGYDSVEDWDLNTPKDDVAKFEVFFDEYNFYKSIRSTDEGYVLFNRVLYPEGETTISEEILADGTRIISSENISEYFFQVPIGYAGEGLEDESLKYGFDPSNWTEEEQFPQTSFDSFSMSLTILPDGSIDEIRIGEN